MPAPAPIPGFPDPIPLVEPRVSFTLGPTPRFTTSRLGREWLAAGGTAEKDGRSRRFAIDVSLEPGTPGGPTGVARYATTNRWRLILAVVREHWASSLATRLNVSWARALPGCMFSYNTALSIDNLREYGPDDLRAVMLGEADRQALGRLREIGGIAREPLRECFDTWRDTRAALLDASEAAARAAQAAEFPDDAPLGAERRWAEGAGTWYARQRERTWCEPAEARCLFVARDGSRLLAWPEGALAYHNTAELYQPWYVFPGEPLRLPYSGRPSAPFAREFDVRKFDVRKSDAHLDALDRWTAKTAVGLARAHEAALAAQAGVAGVRAGIARRADERALASLATLATPQRCASEATPSTPLLGVAFSVGATVARPAPIDPSELERGA